MIETHDCFSLILFYNKLKYCNKIKILLNKEYIIKKSTNIISKEEKIFVKYPIWKSLLIMSIPATILMLFFGLYTFMDNILSINFADDSYKQIGSFTGKNQVRLFMSAATPITTFMFAITMLFGIGSSRRFSIHIGSKNEKRAIQTLNTSLKLGLLVSIILIPVLLLLSKTWMSAQFNGNQAMAKIIANEGFKYVWIIIIAFPIQIFNQIIVGVFRSEGKNKQLLIAQIFPIMINLLFDWIFMSPCHMGIAGGAWATFIAYSFTSFILILYIANIKNTRVKFKNIISNKQFKFIAIIGVLLVGIAPFMRNMAQSITQTIEMIQIQKVSQSVYGDNMKMSLIMTAVFPVFGLFFPMLFGFVQAGSVIIGYNYGAKNIARVKSTTHYIFLFSTITSIFIFILSTFILINPLNQLLGIEDSRISTTFFLDHPKIGAHPPISFLKQNQKLISGGLHKKEFITIYQIPNDPNSAILGFTQIFKEKFHTLDKAQKMYGIMMSSSLFFGPSLGAMALFGSSDRFILNLLASSLRGLILLIPFLFIFTQISINHTGNIVSNLSQMNSVFSLEFLFWWFYPSISFTTSLILFILMIYILKNLDKKHKNLEDKIESFYKKIKK